MRTSFTVMAVLLLVLSSCKVESNVDEMTANQIIYTTSLHNQGGQTKADPQPTKTATLTSLNSEQFGSYVTKHSADSPQPIGTNVYSNVCFDVSAAGQATPAQVLYYPSKTEKVTTYAYYPYQPAGFSDAASIAWSVKSDQTSVESVKASEFLYAKAVGDPVSPETPVALSFAHSLALLQINLTVPVTFVDEEIKTFLDAALKNVASSCAINLNTMVVSAPSNNLNSLPVRLIEVTSPSDDTKLYTYEAVLVPQTIASGTELFSISASFVNTNVANRNFKYNPKDAIVLASNTFHTINLQLTDYGKLELTSASVDDWENASVVGDIGGGGVNNTFCFRLINFNKDYSSSINNAKMIINGETYVFNSSKLKVVGGGKTLTSVDVSLPDNNNKLPQGYPFMVSYAEFFNASSASVVKQGFGTEVSAGGDVLIPWYSYNDINTEGSVGDWGAGSGTSTEKVPINNDFTFMYCNKDATAAKACNNVSKVRLTFSNNATVDLAIAMTGNRFAANTTATVNFSGTVNSGNPITLYPYIITKVEFFVGTVSAYSQTVSLKVKDDCGYAIAVVN